MYVTSKCTCLIWFGVCVCCQCCCFVLWLVCLSIHKHHLCSLFIAFCNLDWFKFPSLCQQLCTNYHTQLHTNRLVCSFSLTLSLPPSLSPSLPPSLSPSLFFYTDGIDGAGISSLRRGSTNAGGSYTLSPGDPSPFQRGARTSRVSTY